MCGASALAYADDNPSANANVPTIRPAGEQQTIRVTTALAPVPLDDATRADLKAFADKRGVDMAELTASHDGIHEFSELATTFESSEADTFVQAGVASSGPWLLFTDRPDDQILSAVASLPVDVDVRFGAPASQEELENAIGALVASLAGESDGVASVSAEIAEGADSIVVRYQRDGVSRASGSTVSFDDALQSAASTQDDGQLPVPVEFTETDNVFRTEETVQGGRGLWVGTTSGVCTAGFTARRPTGNRGVLTAAHCVDNLLYRGLTGVITFGRAARNSSQGRIDIQFHRTNSGHSTNAQFRATGTTAADDRVANGASNPPVGSVVCHWGNTTRYDCAEVAATGLCLTYSDGAARCALTRTDESITDHGDSGGPWFLGNTARGIHAGTTSAGSAFTQIGAATNYLDATVLTG